MIKNLSAVKRVYVGSRNNLRNRNYKSSIKTIIKKVFTEKDDKADHTKLDALVAQAYSKIDKAVKRGIMHKNKAARKKSMLAKKIKIY